jgi:hypothetical protein
MESLEDHNAWVRNIEDVIAMSIRDSGRWLVDLMRRKAGPSSAVKDEPSDELIDTHDKQNVVDEDDYNFFQYLRP